MRKILFDINTQVDCCFHLSKTTDATLALWERHVEDAVRDKDTTIIGTLAYTKLSEKKKYLVRGTNGWMKLHETGVKRPLILPDSSPSSGDVVNAYDTEVPLASGVYFEYNHMTNRNMFECTNTNISIMSLLLLAKPTLEQRQGWYFGGQKLIINHPTEVTVIGPKVEVAPVLFQFREWVEKALVNPENLVKITYVEPR